MANYTDKVIKKLTPAAIKQINQWQKEFIKTPLNADQADYGIYLSTRIDELWHTYAKELATMRQRTTDRLTVWGQPEQEKREVPLAQKDKIYEQEKLSRGVSNSSDYRRLKLVMDYWCSLWFWPLEEAENLPSRKEFFSDIGMILGVTEMVSSQQLSLFYLYSRKLKHPSKRRILLRNLVLWTWRSSRVFPSVAVGGNFGGNL
ncbi:MULTISPECIES: hypothetical protein [Limnospira]|uniref:Uncharacterized protein n=1 Tax=Limnospira platensis NIES-46 TaxID=1236695 RepID=A0A5M3TE09_LIMPL|nr:hypothetical protein [Arthrospira platensis]MDF2211529.1 hypothetical protein [Arthrospira platensis NCB002]MDT9295576.1 hypothetical protein [Arthrospira platensis PCC 7345]BAI88432.1 hypothetical protein NIES39_A05940 [Arthrospira platensis NIES-39]BDT10844.1 hypothetical protein N39L_05670 [Arthrospira platensis NIES-39]GCE96321.1 hypothetical protein NIES46_43900 [Arthrospira platensis NIES-46]